VFVVVLWPVAWMIYTLLHGQIGYRNWYPYPFLNVARLGLERVALNWLLVTLLQLAVALIYRCLDGQLGPAPMEISTVDRP